MDRKQAEQILEQLIDKHNLDSVFEMISNVCFEKARHLESNWRDAKTAKQWDSAGKLIYDISITPRILRVGSGR